MVSANAFDKGRKNEAGIRYEDFLVKPVNVVELLELIRDRLDLRWVPVPEVGFGLGAGGSADSGERSIASLLAPPTALLHSLHELGSLGYVRGILDKLSEIERLDPAYEVFTGTLRAHVERFDLPEYLRHVERTLRTSSDATS